MKVKRILRFYFSAEKLNSAVDNLILKRACAPCADGREGAERICGLIGEKQELQRFWGYLDGIIGKLAKEDIRSLGEYAAIRCGVKSLEREDNLRLKRAVVKFTRRVKRLEDFAEALGLVGKYYCLL